MLTIRYFDCKLSLSYLPNCLRTFVYLLFHSVLENTDETHIASHIAPFENFFITTSNSQIWV